MRGDPPRILPLLLLGVWSACVWLHKQLPNSTTLMCPTLSLTTRALDRSAGPPRAHEYCRRCGWWLSRLYLRRRWGSVSDVAVVGARVIHGRLPATRRQNGAILRHGPPPSYARGQGAVGGVEPRRCIPASYAGRSARGGGPVSGARRPRVGRYRLSRPHAPAKFAGPQM